MCHLSGDCPGVLRWVEHQYLRIYACREQSQDQSVYTIITQILTEKVDHVVHIGGSQSNNRSWLGVKDFPSFAFISFKDFSSFGVFSSGEATSY